MEMLAQWVPTTPEMEVKVLFGRHVWDCAQHADALGRRAFELRAPLHYTLPAVEHYQSLLREMAVLEPTPDRVSAFYDVLCPGIAERYRAYMTNTDGLMDEPTVRVLHGILRDQERMLSERDRLAAVSAHEDPVINIAQWKQRERVIGGIVAHGDGHKRARGVPA